MALDINTGYSATFKAFAEFATQSVKAGKAKAVASASAPDRLQSRNLSAYEV